MNDPLIQTVAVSLSEPLAPSVVMRDGRHLTWEVDRDRKSQHDNQDGQDRRPVPFDSPVGRRYERPSLIFDAEWYVNCGVQRVHLLIYIDKQALRL